MIFVAVEPITEDGIIAALSDTGVDRKNLREVLASIENEWNQDSSRGIGLVQVAGGYQFRTKPVHAEWLKRLNLPKAQRLSGPALETLAIVAYRQPIVRSEIEKIRGVDTGGVLKTLLERRLLRIVGRQDEPGQPLLYGTTKEFLETFNLKGLSELPTLKDIEELMREQRIMTETPPSTEIATPDDEDEEQTELIEDEEKTETIRRRPPEDGDEGDAKDTETLSNLEENLKNLRHIERNIFPKMPEEKTWGNYQDAPAPQLEQGLDPETQGIITPSAAQDGAKAHEALADDRPVE